MNFDVAVRFHALLSGPTHRRTGPSTWTEWFRSSDGVFKMHYAVEVRKWRIGIKAELHGSSRK